MKRINFKDYPLFMPMLRPNEMIELGVAGGIMNPWYDYCSKKSPSLSDRVYFEQELLENLDVTGYPSFGKNHFGLAASYGRHLPSQGQPLPFPLKFMVWYFGFFYGLRQSITDIDMIKHWENHLLKTYDTQFIEVMDTRVVKQTLLELSWWYTWEPKTFLHHAKI